MLTLSLTRANKEELGDLSAWVLTENLWRHISKKRRVQILLLLLLIIGASLAEVLSLGLLLPFLGVLTDPSKIYYTSSLQPTILFLGLDRPEQLLLPTTAAFISAAIMAGLVRVALVKCQIELGHLVGADLSSAMYRNALYQPYSIHVARNSNEIISNILSHTNTIVHYILLPALTLIGSTLLLASVLLTLTLINPLITIVSIFGFGCIYLSISFVTRDQIKQSSEHVRDGMLRVLNALQEGLGGIRDVILDKSQSTFARAYVDVDSPRRHAQAKIEIMAISPRYIVESLGMALMGVVAFYTTRQAENLLTVVPTLGAIAFGAQRLMPIMHQGYSAWVYIRGAKLSLAEALELLNETQPEESHMASEMPFEKTIELQRISFQYSDQRPFVLKELSLVIKKGMRVGIIGDTGSGKSTLLDILMGLLSPSTGSVLIDKISLDAKSLSAWRARVAHVPQMIFLADSSIAANIAFGVPSEKIDMRRVREAAAAAQIAETIESWEEGYNTTVGERGVRLSGGQRQRIGIARALYKSSDVIFFDEATSALDGATEQAVMRCIDALNSSLTIFMVAHRLTTLRSCDVILELAGGGVRRSGTFQEIIENK